MNRENKEGVGKNILFLLSKLYHLDTTLAYWFSTDNAPGTGNGVQATVY